MAAKQPAAMTITEEFAARVRQEGQKERIMKYAPVLVLLVMMLIFSVVCGKSFASINNMVAILNQLAIPLLVAIGLTFVIMIGGIDLSIDGTVGMAAALLGVLVMNNRFPVNLGALGLLLAIAGSVLVGLLIGLIHVYLRVPSFLVSFAFMYVCKGIGLLS
jgi:ribose transport system permease protein